MKHPHTPQSTQSVDSSTGLSADASARATVSSLPQADAVPLLMLAMVLVSVVLLILVGGTLFGFPEVAQARWVWPLKPYNTRFLGAIYLTALVGLLSLVASRRLALARLIIPMMAVFTTIVLMVSCLQIQQFDPARRATDLWLWLYLVDCVGATYFCGFLRNHSFSGLRRLPGKWPMGLWIQTGLMGVYGASLLLSPVAAGSVWLWPLDVFHSQLYSAIFLSGALGSALLARSATAVEMKSLGAIQVAFSVLVLLGLWIVDRNVQGVDWAMARNWGWVGAIALLGIMGIGLIKQSSWVR